MNPFLLAPRERLSDWKTFRTTLSALPEPDQLAAVSHYWSKAPLVNFAYDAEDPSTWPTIWEMILEGTWCECSVAIGMEQTLRLAGWHEDRLKLALIKDYDLSAIRFVVEIDGKTWLNYNFDSVSEIPSTSRSILCVWQFTGKSYRPA